MKRRSFLKVFASAFAFAPIVTKAISREETDTLYPSIKNPLQKQIDISAKNLADTMDSEISAMISKGERITIGDDPSIYVCTSVSGSGGAIISKDTIELFNG